MKKLTAIICVIFAFIMAMALPVGAAAPYQTYTYSIEGTALHSPEAYTPAKAVDSAYMGLNSEEILNKYYAHLEGNELEAKKIISNPTDLEVDDQLNVYVADTDNNRIVVLNRYYKVKFILESFTNENGIPDKLSRPQGVFITEGEKGRIFVCDTGNSRIVTFNRDGSFNAIIPEPEGEILERDTVYAPTALAVDKYDRLYVVNPSDSNGIMVMTDTGVFTGYIGAQKVVLTAWEKLWRNFQSEEQKLTSETKNAKSFNNIALFGDFIYVTTSQLDEASAESAITSKSTSGDFAPVKMLNAAGTEIMRRNGFYPPSGEVDMKRLKMTDKIYGPSMIVDVATGPEKTWSIIDQKRSKVFTYDFDGNLLFAFGDTGNQLGNISTQGGLNAVTYQGDNMLLLDNSNKTFTVFERTEYGDILINALRNQNERRYDKAIDDWREILKRNSNFDAAYIGIGNALYRSNNLEEALEHYKAAYDTENYSVAYKDLRKEWMSKFIILIPVVVIAICFAFSKFMKYANKVNKRVATAGEKRTYGQELLYVFHVIFHPFDGFWDLKHEKRGSVRAACTVLGMVVITFYYQAIGRGYLLNPQEQYSTFFEVILSLAAPFALWTISNWCLTTLFDGEGSYKDIFIATCYALMPTVIIMIPTTIASNFLVAEELDILAVVNAFAYIWAGMLIFFGMMVTHDYSMGKNFLTTLGTIVGMIVIMFIVLLFTTLLGKIVGFITNIVTEIQFRL